MALGTNGPGRLTGGGAMNVGLAAQAINETPRVSPTEAYVRGTFEQQENINGLLHRLEVIRNRIFGSEPPGNDKPQPPNEPTHLVNALTLLNDRQLTILQRLGYVVEQLEGL